MSEEVFKYSFGRSKINLCAEFGRSKVNISTLHIKAKGHSIHCTSGYITFEYFKMKCNNNATCVYPFSLYFRDHFYQFGEIRSVNVVTKQQCAFVQFTTRHAAEAACEKSFNKLIIGGRRLNIKWGKSQAQTAIKRDGEEPEKFLEPVPGLPGGMLQPFHPFRLLYFNPK